MSATPLRPPAADRPPDRRRVRATLVALGLAVALGVVLLLAAPTMTGPAAHAAETAAATAAGTATGRVPQPTITVPASGTCVAPAAEMRRSHMAMLVHQRDRTVRDGVRGAKVSLAGCVDCHATATGAADGTRAVTGHPGAFCESCHRYAAVTLDCFECHSAKARPAAAARLDPAGGK
jgi:hypothetical protein